VPLSDIVRVALEKAIRNHISGYKDWNIDHKKGKQMWRYESETDFWYGHVIGTLRILSYTSFKDTMGRLPNKEEEEEIHELIQVHGTEVRKIVENWK